VASRRRKNDKPSGRASAAKALRDTRMCECEQYKPAIVTKTKNGKVKGYCEDCIILLS
jgi:hypothetical protein